MDQPKSAGKDASIHPRKLEIVAAAVSCFIEQGYHQTGIRDIARTAGISLGNVYNHFAGKEAVLTFIAEMEADEIGSFVTALSADAPAPSTRLRQFIAAYAEYSARPENALLGIEILAEAMRNTTIAQAFEKNRENLIAALAACLDADDAALSAPPREIACMILDLIEGQGLRAFLGPDQNPAPSQTLECFIIAAVKL